MTVLLFQEVLGKVIMGGKNLCVTSQHNANSINVQPHHISLNNGDQTKTMLPTANSPQNAEFIKTNIKVIYCILPIAMSHLICWIDAYVHL